MAFFIGRHMTTPPARTDISATPSPSNAVAKAALGVQWDVLFKAGTGLLGTTGNAVDARTALGAVAKAGDSWTGAQNEARATVASAATTADIWGAAGNSINWTGTATTTAFPAAPQAGAKRRLHCAGACSFTHSATLDIRGNANFTAAAGDFVDVEAITTTTFVLIPNKEDGTPIATTQATETARGTAQVATQAETDAGAIDTDMVTPLKLRNGFASSLTTNGYIKLPSWLLGLIFQWGQVASATYASSTNTTLTITHPITFPTAVWWSGMFFGTKHTTPSTLSGTATTTGIDGNINNASGTSLTTMIRWFSLGT